ncbi:hypothetical protein ACHQM5_005926 [Ranunculus cassubicifolius]
MKRTVEVMVSNSHSQQKQPKTLMRKEWQISLTAKLTFLVICAASLLLLPLVLPPLPPPPLMMLLLPVGILIVLLIITVCPTVCH